MDIIALIVSIGTLIYFLFLKKKKETLQVVGDFIVYNSDGITKGKISKGDTILGKKENTFIIADVDNLPAYDNLGIYLSNRKKNRK